METIVGIGTAGCNIAQAFKNYGMYDVYQINVALHRNESFYGLKEQNTHEDYERSTPDFSEFFSKIDSDTLVIVCGSGMVSGITLKVLEQLTLKLTSNKVSVLYIKPFTCELSFKLNLNPKSSPC